MEFREHTLSNGLQVIAECNPRAYSMALGFFVRAGSRDESPEIAGVSHFLEHMVFKGTPQRSAAEVNLELDEMGANSNAYTSEEQTVYYATVLPELQSRAFTLLADILRPSLRDDDFMTEKKVIIEEIRKYDDQPPYGAHEKCMAKFFGDHPLGNSVLGTEQTVGALTPKQMKSYFQQRYSPSNIVVTATGKVDFEQLIADAERICGDWPAYSAERSVEQVDCNTGLLVIPRQSVTQQYSIQIGSAPCCSDTDRYAARLLTMILGDDVGSRYYWNLIDKGLAEYAAASNYEYQGAGITMAYLCCDPGQTSSNLQLLNDLQREVESNGVTADELDLAQNKITSHVVLQAERPSNRLFSVGNSWIQRQSYHTVAETVDAYHGVTLGDVREVIDNYGLTRNATCVVGPEQDICEPCGNLA